MTQKTSSSPFDQWFGKKRYFPMRMFKGACPLTLNERVAWSFIVDKTPVGGSHCGRNLTGDRAGAGPDGTGHQEELVRKHLAELSGNRLSALPPDPEWEVSRPGDRKTPWYKRLNYYPMCHTPSCWTVAQNVIYFCLLTSNMQCGKKVRPKPEEGRDRCHARFVPRYRRRGRSNCSRSKS